MSRDEFTRLRTSKPLQVQFETFFMAGGWRASIRYESHGAVGLGSLYKLSSPSGFYVRQKVAYVLLKDVVSKFCVPRIRRETNRVPFEFIILGWKYGFDSV